MNGNLTERSSDYVISLNYQADNIRIYKAAIKVLGSPHFLQFWINPDAKMLYMRGINIRDKDCFDVSDDRDSRCIAYRFHGRRFIKRISRIAGWELTKVYSITGLYDAEMNVLAFSLSEGIERTRAMKAVVSSYTTDSSHSV